MELTKCIESTWVMGDSVLVPMTCGWFYLIWEVSFSCYGVAYLASFPNPPDIEAKYSLSFARSIISLSSLAFMHSKYRPTTWGLFFFSLLFPSILD
jgi:hypothetical protein